MSPTGPLYGHTVGIDQHPHSVVGDTPKQGKDDTADKLDPYAIQLEQWLNVVHI